MALVPPSFLDAVVALEQQVASSGDEAEYRAVASGVVVGMSTEEQNEKAETIYRIFLATNRHVLPDNENLYVRFNKGDKSARFGLGTRDKGGRPAWTEFEDFDIAVSPLDVQALREAGADLNFVPEDHLMGMEQMEERGVSVGDAVFVLGFPLGLAGTEKKYAVVRAGVVARLDAEIVDETKAFLIDSTVFPGNSGGLVLLRPEVVALSGTKAISTAFAVGIVSGYLPYVDVAVSEQTHKPRVAFEENSGLATVVPMDAVKGAVAACMRAHAPDPGETATAESAE